MGRIKNDDREGNIIVTLYAAHHQIASFQTRNIKGAMAEVEEMAAERARRRLPTKYSLRRKLRNGDWEPIDRYGNPVSPLWKVKAD